MFVRKYSSKYLVLSGIESSAENFRKLSEILSYKKWEGRDLVFDPTGSAIKIICKYYPNAVWDTPSSEILNRYIKSLQEAEATKNFVNYVDDFKFKTEPFEHQKKAFYMSRDLDSFALFMEQGTGKTKVAIDLATHAYATGKITALVVIAPNGVHRNWLQEIDIHMPEYINHQKIHYSSGMNKTRSAEFEKIIDAPDCLRIFTFNVEAFATATCYSWFQKIVLQNKLMLVVDESTRIKNHGAKRTKVITKLGRDQNVVKKLILTGTPVTKGCEDLYSQFKFLDPLILGYESFYSFRNRYCVMGGYEGRQVISYKNTEELANAVDGFSFRVLKKDCLDLPEKIYQRHTFDLSPKERQVYRELKTNLMTELDGEVLAAPEAITNMLRLQQISGGWFPSESPRKIDKTSSRINALKEVLAGISSKTIIWARFIADIKMIEELLGDKAVSYYGSVSSDDRVNNVERFCNDPSVRYFIGQPASGGIGLTLVSKVKNDPVGYTIYYSNSFDLEHRLQSEDRCHRIGTTSNVTYIDLQALKTVDNRIITALRKKKSLADLITQDPKSIFMEEDDE